MTKSHSSTTMRPIVTHAVVADLALSLVLGALLLAVVRANGAIMLNDYPPDIKAKWGPMTARAKRQRWLAAGVSWSRFSRSSHGVVTWCGARASAGA
jgi:hypothetical protein